MLQRLELGDLQSSSQPKLFYDSNVGNVFSNPLWDNAKFGVQPAYTRKYGMMI